MNAQRRTPSGHASRRGFTLTELLVVIMVIGILSSTMLFAMYGAVQQAKESRARTQVVKLHDLLMTRWDSYRTRPVRLLEAPGLTALPTVIRRDGRAMAAARLNALRDLMRMEMPDRITDVRDAPIVVTQPYNYRNPYGAVMSGNTQITVVRPALSRQYFRRAEKMTNDTNFANWTVTHPWTTTHQGSECLYLIIASIRDITGNGLDVLQDGEIGDTDGDGMLEILDPWGNPIQFVRWAPGFVDHPGTNLAFGDGDDVPSYSNLQSGDPTTSPDPLDPLRVDQRGPVAWGDGSGTAQYQFNFALYPLVCSSGPDGKFGIVLRDFDPADPASIAIFDYYRNQANPHGSVRNDPYSIMPTSDRRLGEPFLESSEYVDNIHNHAIETR